ncbi:hypothetical protein Plhal710r2_c075g0179051 [Plasmopara halstedii]
MRLHKIMLTIFHDRQFRLAFRLLPVRLRFWFASGHSHRNRCLFDGRQPTPAASALGMIFATFSAHIRFFKRRL